MHYGESGIFACQMFVQGLAFMFGKIAIYSTTRMSLCLVNIKEGVSKLTHPQLDKTKFTILQGCIEEGLHFYPPHTEYLDTFY